MKKLLGLICIALPVFALGGDTPAAFHKMYPNATVRRVKNEKKDICVYFRNDGKKYQAYFENDGRWEKTQRKIALTRELPSNVRSGFMHSGYEGCNVDGIWEVIAPGRHNYEIWVDNGDYFDSDHHDSFTHNNILYFNTQGQMTDVQRKSMVASL